MAWSKHIFLTFIEYLTAKLELCLVDYKNGGFLPPEKRALRVPSQGPIGHLVSKMARFRILDEEPMLRNKLLVMSSVLRNEYPELPPAYFSKNYKPRRG